MASKVLVLGAGKIGRFVACLLANHKDFDVMLSDIQQTPCLQNVLSHSDLSIEFLELDVLQEDLLKETIAKKNIDVLVSCLPHFHTLKVAEIAAQEGTIYLDLTEDVKVSEGIGKLAQSSQAVMVPQCGLAPGFVSIIAQHLIDAFDEVDTVKMRVGALPMNVSNALQYALTWSTDGLINEYIQDSRVIRDGEMVLLPGLTGLETIKIDGLTYEAFHTSGGIGSLVDSQMGKVKHMDYKTIRYPGHCHQMQLLLRDLKLDHHPEMMRQILEDAVPQTQQDIVLVYVSVSGTVGGQFVEKNFAKKFYPETHFEQHWTAIQMTTASSVCAVLAWLMGRSDLSKGLLKQEQIPYQEFVDNDYGQLFTGETGEWVYE